MNALPARDREPSSPGAERSVDLIVDRAGKTFETARGPVRALEPIDLKVARGAFVALIGPSGCGKSTLLRMVAGLEQPGDGGAILVRGKHPEQFRKEGELGIAFQDAALLPWRSVTDNIAFPLHILGRPVKGEAAHIQSLIELVGLKGYEAALPGQLSGGMRQRVAIAIALINKPDLVIADEPTTALDVSIQAQILAEVQQLTREAGTALLWITHDLSVIAGIADEIAVMYAGRIVEQGGVDAVLDRPSHPYTAGLIGSLPGASAPGSMLVQIPGTTPDMVDPPQGCASGPRCARRAEDCARQPGFTEGAHRLRCFHPLSGPASPAEVAA